MAGKQNRRKQSRKHRLDNGKMSRDQLLWVQDLRRSNAAGVHEDKKEKRQSKYKKFYLGD